jgi:serine/threonine protein kinase
LDFLYYCAENPILYRSQLFVKFFEDLTSKQNSPVDDCDNETKDLISPSREESFEESHTSLASNEESIDIACALEENFINHFDNDIDYLYDAALEFSKAVQEEANQRYKSAFDLYKSGIDKLLTGAKSDKNESRKKIAKTKASKYLEKAETLYENFIIQQQENEFFIEDTDLDESQSISSLERPFSNLSKYKVVEVNERIMKVQDRTDKAKMYIIKVIWKSHTHKVLFMPQKIPFMVSLQSYFHSENSIFLLLPYITGGLLWNYIQNYKSDSVQSKHKIEELFVEPYEKIEQIKISQTESINECDAIEINDLQDQIDVVEIGEEQDEVDSTILSQETAEAHVPCFDTLSDNIDINDLMECSQKLLKSVTKTLERSVVISSVSDEKEPIISDTESLSTDEVVLNEKINDVKKKLVADVRNDEILGEKSEPVPEFVIRQWISEIIVCVNALHKNGIILGDLNLNNILLGSNGHVMLTYFSTYFQRNDRNSFHQLCYLNTKAIKCMYVAFEFPITKSSDYYSIGVIFYEIITKQRFYLNHPGGISKYNEVQFPETVTLSDDAKDLIFQLIFIRNNSYDDIIKHKFFENVNFGEIEKCAHK